MQNRPDEISDPFPLPAGAYRLSLDLPTPGPALVALIDLGSCQRIGNLTFAGGASHGEDLEILRQPARVALAADANGSWLVTVQPLG